MCGRRVLEKRGGESRCDIRGKAEYNTSHQFRGSCRVEKSGNLHVAMYTRSGGLGTHRTQPEKPGKAPGSSIYSLFSEKIR